MQRRLIAISAPALSRLRRESSGERAALGRDKRAGQRAQSAAHSEIRYNFPGNSRKLQLQRLSVASVEKATKSAPGICNGTRFQRLRNTRVNTGK